MYKNILIATDGSALSGKGIDHGLALAKVLDATVTVVTVTGNEVPSPRSMAEDVRQGINPLEIYRQAMTEEALEILRSATAKASAAGLNVKTVHIAERPAAEGILQAANEHGCDLIVMSSHGRRGISRLLLGSQTAEVVATTSVPVLVVR